MVERFWDEVERAIAWLARPAETGIPAAITRARFERAARVFGRSALLLSGGASLGFFHVGVAKALFAHELMYTLRGQPVVYYGDEQGLVGSGGDQDARQSLFATGEALELHALGIRARCRGCCTRCRTVAMCLPRGPSWMVPAILRGVV